MQHQRKRSMWMRSVVAVAALLGVVGLAHAGVIAYDNLESAALGSINGQTSGTGFAGGYVLGSGAIGVVTNQSLSYSSGDITANGGTNCIFVGYPDKTVFTRAVGTNTSDTLYLSFLFRTPTADGSASSTGTTEDFLTFGFNNAVGESSAGVVHRYNGASTDHAFGIRTNLSADVRGTVGTEANRTYFAVLRLRKLTPGATQNYNELALFVDPSSKYEPAPTLIATNTGWASATYLAARTAFMEVGDTYFLDNLCVGDTYNSVAYPTGGSPVTDQPVITPRSGANLGTLTVTMSSPTAGATIFYTTDGSTPSSTHGTEYTVPFTLSASCRVQAIATSTGKFDSAVTVVDYTVQSHWIGGGADTNWATVANWDPAVNPAGRDVVFDNARTNNGTRVSNRVEANTTVGSLSYTNSGGSGIYHVTQIDAGTTLTVDGGTSPANALFVGRTSTETSTTYTRVKMIGGGAFVLNAPQAEGWVTKRSSDQHGEAYLDLSGLSACTMAVSNFSIGRFDRGAGFVTLPTNGVGTSLITAARLGVGDSDGGANGDASELILGRTNTLNVSSIGIGAAVLGTYNQNKGTLRFLTGSVSPILTIRGTSGGSSRADLTLGSQGKTTSNRNVSGNLPLTNGTVNAMIGTLLLADGRGQVASGGTGQALGTFSMVSGNVDASTGVVGRASGGTAAASAAVGTLNVSGGRFVVGVISMAESLSGASQSTMGYLNVSGSGSVEVAGDLTLGTNRSGLATNITATVDLSGGSLTVLGNMASGASPTGVTSVVTLRGGALTVTNATGDATLRIERGTLAIKAGAATLNRLVTTNALAATQIELRGTGSGNYGQMAVSGDVRLGGTLKVTLNGYTLRPGDAWTIVGGTGTRTGTFATPVDLPENLRLFYTAEGYRLAYPAAATILLIR